MQMEATQPLPLIWLLLLRLVGLAQTSRCLEPQLMHWAVYLRQLEQLEYPIARNVQQMKLHKLCAQLGGGCKAMRI